MKFLIPFTDFGHLSVGGTKTKVHLFYFKFFNTLFASFFGGRPHVGAVTASFTPNSKTLSKTLRMPGHKDDVVTKKAQVIFSKGIKGPVVTLAGIHYNKATAPQIKTIVKNSEKLSRRLITVLKNQS